MRDKQAGALRRSIRFVWNAVDGLRRVVVNLVFLLFLAIVLVAIFARAEHQVPADSALLLHPTGHLVEQVAVSDPLSLLRGGIDPEQTTVRDLLDAIAAARADRRITGLALETDGLDGAGMAKLQEIRAALKDFRASGKPVLAWGSRFTQGQYFLASAADEVYMAPDGFVLLQGFANYQTYFKGLLDKLGVRMHVFKVGTYKSAVEPYTRSSMSDADRRASGELLDGLWAQWREGVAEGRSRLAANELAALASDYPAKLAAAGGDASRLAVDSGLVDGLLAVDQWQDLLRKRFGKDDQGRRPKLVAVDEYLAAVRSEVQEPSETIAVVAVQGVIVDGEQPPGVAAGETVSGLLKRVREDDSIKALVLRIDSPGGSVFASERIRREVDLVRQAGKPVVASMSAVAASGGYWVAMAADEVWAGPASVTGSIGIFGMFPDFSEPLGRIGVAVDGVATTPTAGGLDPRRPLSPALASALQSSVENGYRRFVGLVSEARRMSPEAVEEVAEGRVWSGARAQQLGLVDKLGGLRAAIGAAAARASLEHYRVEWVEPRLNARDQILQRLLRAVAGGEEASVPGVLQVLRASIARELAALEQWNDPGFAYARCFCGGP